MSGSSGLSESKHDNESSSLYHSLLNAKALFDSKRSSLGLTNPGAFENVGRETTSDVLLSNYMFSGLRADVSKQFSASPIFQYTHAFSMGCPGASPYSFLATYGTPKIFMHGTVDGDGQLAARLNYRWTQNMISRVQTQIAPSQAMARFEHEYTGADFSAAVKALNPSALDGGLTGIFIGSFLQSVTARLALGFESIWQRTAMNAGPETANTLVANYKTPDWSGSIQLQTQGTVVSTYWRRLSEKVQVGAEMVVQAAPVPGPYGGISSVRTEGTAALGARYDFRASTLRTQADSTGKLSALLEKRVLPFLQLTFAGELDHGKQQGKVGLSVAFEMPSSQAVIDQQEKLLQENIQGPPL